MWHVDSDLLLHRCRADLYGTMRMIQDKYLKTIKNGKRELDLVESFMTNKNSEDEGKKDSIRAMIARKLQSQLGGDDLEQVPGRKDLWRASNGTILQVRFGSIIVEVQGVAQLHHKVVPFFIRKGCHAPRRLDNRTVGLSYDFDKNPPQRT